MSLTATTRENMPMHAKSAGPKAPKGRPPPPGGRTGPMTGTRMPVALFAVAVGFGCSSGPTEPSASCDPDSPGPSIAGAMRDRLPPFPPSGHWTINEIWADIARQVPGGWGGFFVMDDQPVHYLVYPDRKDEALAALDALGVESPFTSREPAVRQGRWDFAQLYDWYTYILVTVPWHPALEYTDIDEMRNRLVYSVSDTQAVESLTSALENADLPCELVIVQVGDGDMVY